MAFVQSVCVQQYGCKGTQVSYTSPSWKKHSVTQFSLAHGAKLK